MVGIQANGDVNHVVKVLTAIAYFNKGKSVAEVLHNIEHLTQEQKERWGRLNVALYKQFTEPGEVYRPNGEPYYYTPEPKFNEEDKPF